MLMKYDNAVNFIKKLFMQHLAMLRVVKNINCCSLISKVPLPMPCVEKSTPFMQFKVVAVSKYATKNIILKIM